MGIALQTFSHYPAWPPPVEVSMVVDQDHPCPYLPDRPCRNRAFLAERIAPEIYHSFMDSGFRRSGEVIYQPICRGCRECVPIRVMVHRFRPSKSQRRCRKRNMDLNVRIDVPKPTDEKFDLYLRYVRDWHGDGLNTESREGFERFLYRSPVDTIEFMYRDAYDRLLAVGICDVSARSVSSMYFYFDPSEARRGLGTFGALCELDYCRTTSAPHYYLGYWIRACRTMKYKSSFRPCELLQTDGIWRPLD